MNGRTNVTVALVTRVVAIRLLPLKSDGDEACEGLPSLLHRRPPPRALSPNRANRADVSPTTHGGTYCAAGRLVCVTVVVTGVAVVLAVISAVLSRVPAILPHILPVVV